MPSTQVQGFDPLLNADTADAFFQDADGDALGSATECIDGDRETLCDKEAGGTFSPILTVITGVTTDMFIRAVSVFPASQYQLGDFEILIGTSAESLQRCYFGAGAMNPQDAQDEPVTRGCNYEGVVGALQLKLHGHPRSVSLQDIQAYSTPGPRPPPPPWQPPPSPPPPAPVKTLEQIDETSLVQAVQAVRDGAGWADSNSPAEIHLRPPTSATRTGANARLADEGEPAAQPEIIISDTISFNNLSVSEVWLNGGAGVTLRLQEDGRRRRLNSSSSSGTPGRPLVLVAGSVAVNLVALTIIGDASAPAVVVADSAILRFINCSFVDSPGGALQVSGEATVSVSQTTFERNSGFCGGAIQLLGGTTDISDSSITDNSAINGGAICMFKRGLSPPALTIQRTSITRNAATDYGGGLFVDGSCDAHCSIELADHARFVNNEAPTGKSIYMDSLSPLAYRLPAPLGTTLRDGNVQQLHLVTYNTLDDDFPYDCAAGLYGQTYDLEAQGSPSCSGQCTSSDQTWLLVTPCLKL